MKAVEGPSAFNSGTRVTNNSFLHTFEEEGMYCVVSDGADYTYCVIKVVRTSKKTKTPTLVKEEHAPNVPDNELALKFVGNNKFFKAGQVEKVDAILYAALDEQEDGKYTFCKL